MSNKSIAGFAISVSLLLALCLPDAGFASGTYSGRPSRPPTSIDRASYELGKNVFSGKIEATATADEAAQRLELEALQGRLSSKARTRAKFVELAGRLSDEQVEALRYFLKKRYKIQSEGE